MRHLYLLVMGAVFLTGCNENNENQRVPVVTEKTAQQELDANQTKWANANLSSYTYAYEVLCFCAPEGNIVVNVRNGEVVSAFFSPSGVLLSPERLTQERTMDEFFGFIQTGLDEPYAKMDVVYNEQFGFPESLDVDLSTGLADDEAFYNIGSLQ